MDDFGLVVASMRQQYGLRIQGEEFATMGWDEFADLLAGLNKDTPLVQMAIVRTESDPERLKSFTKGQLRERAEWQRRRALNKPQSETSSFLADMERTLSNMLKEG